MFALLSREGPSDFLNFYHLRCDKWSFKFQNFVQFHVKIQSLTKTILKVYFDRVSCQGYNFVKNLKIFSQTRHCNNLLGLKSSVEIKTKHFWLFWINVQIVNSIASTHVNVLNLSFLLSTDASPYKNRKRRRFVFVQLSLLNNHSRPIAGLSS